MGIEEAFEIGFQRGEVGRAFKIKASPTRERMGGKRALAALARAYEKYSLERPEEKSKPIVLLPWDVFHVM